MYFLSIELKRSSSLLESVTGVLCCYQKLVPTILAQGQINVMKFLSDLMPLSHSVGDFCVFRTLRLISNAPVEMLRNSVKVCIFLLLVCMHCTCTVCLSIYIYLFLLLNVVLLILIITL